ncbi:hypothetical protein SAMN02745248_00453 [Hathewaya proteolytica DSM 3090]|uniref:Uncharacterized protein n=1 Tax=Hathewaya proteolytica DSM 3090 TaxID=1121331 RepID=A0A1M6KFX6_9CLOT|nr:Qat anti-phage system associated protein QatB [Hathewaya proteolytica]SHJ57752.1 hypothetical protein SAMN02745248_00453 [Hathewaya proteolytica DSM 3090]
MGTSTRNKGQSGHTPLVPSWLEGDDTNGNEGQNVGGNMPIPPEGDVNRFTAPRGTFTRYLSSGGRDGSFMRSSISQYVSHSLGGSSRATTRLGAARHSTARLYNVLSSLSRNGGVSEVAHQLSIDNLEGLSASSFFTNISSFVCPDGGPNDEGMARSAYFDTIAENPILNEKKIEELTAQDCMTVLQKYMCKVIMEHIKNDIANKIIILPNDIDEISRIEGSVEQLIQQSVSDAFAEVQQNSAQMTNIKAEQITDSVYKKTYDILEGQGE